MKAQEALLEMETSFRPYSAIWDDWYKAKQHSFSEVEVYILEVHRRNKFMIADSSIPMFYNRIDNIKCVADKLQEEFTDFQDWAILKFQYELIKMAKIRDWDKFFSTPLSELDIPRALEKNLEYYHVDTLDELFTKYADGDFRKPELFQNVVLFLLELKKEGIEYNTLKKHVA